MSCMRRALASCVSHGCSNDLVKAPGPQLRRTGFIGAGVASSYDCQLLGNQFDPLNFRSWPGGDDLPGSTWQSDALYVPQARRSKSAPAWAAEIRRAITCRKPEYLSAAMDSRMAVVVHSAEMRDDNATELTIVNRRARCIDDLDENVPLRNVEITRRLLAGDRKQAELRRTVEVTYGFHTTLPHRHDRRGVECPARAYPPAHAMTFEPSSISFEKRIQTRTFPRGGLAWNYQRVEVEQLRLRQGRENLF
jgi:hypothetical protein